MTTTLTLPTTDEERALLGATERRVVYFDADNYPLEIDEGNLPPAGTATAVEHLHAADGTVVATNYYTDIDG